MSVDFFSKETHTAYTSAQNKARIAVRRATEPGFEEKYLAQRRAQKARGRAKKKAQPKPPKPPKTHCRKGLHLWVPGQKQCKECQKLAKQRSIALHPKPKKFRTRMTRSEIRERERKYEAITLGRPVLTLAEFHAKRHAASITPEAIAVRAASAQRGKDKAKAKRQAAKMLKPPKACPKHPLQILGACCVCLFEQSRYIMQHGPEYKIYALVDPRGPEIFYVGCTYRPGGRLANHIFNKNGKRAASPECGERIAEILEAGVKPNMVILEITEDFMREEDWIEFFRHLGLTNRVKFNAYSVEKLRKNLRPAW